MVFSGPYFAVYGENHVCIFPYIVDSVHRCKNTDTILSIDGKTCIRESLDFGIIHAVTLIRLELKKQ